MTLGAQLYTLREQCETLEDFATSLQKVADIGYTTVQVSGTCAYEGEWLKEQLKQTGLRCVCTHYSPAELTENPNAVIAKHKTFDCTRIGLGMMPGGIEKYDDFVTTFKPICNTLKQQGCYLLYHNHAFEYTKSDDGRIYMDRLAEAFLPEEMGFTLDTYWIQAGGGDAAQWIRKLAGRVPCIHLKDMSYEGEVRMAPVGEGNMNFEGILQACEDANAQYLLVEQDDCYDEDSFACLKKSYQNLKAMGLR